MFNKYKYNIFFSSFILVFFLAGCSSQSDSILYDRDYNLSSDENILLDSIQHKTFLFFMNERNTENGLVKDRSASWAPASIAAIGFALPSYAVGVERGWIRRDEAAEITLNILKFFMNSVQSPDTNVTGYQGFYYHFLKMDSGLREWNCELSTVDTGLLMMGIIFARNYFNFNDKLENEIRDLSTKLIGRLNWDFFEMPNSSEHSGSISMGWTPEKGLHKMGWVGYNEALFLYIIAAGSGMTNAEDAYETWLKSYDWRTPYPDLSHVVFPPLFGHQFSFCFIDPKGLQDMYLRVKGIDYFENSRRATYVQWEYAIENPKDWSGYDSLCWGISASDGPGETFNYDNRKFLAYAGRGTSGSELNYFDDGTIAPYAAISSIVFAPEIVFPTILSFNERYAEGLWRSYGYVDAFNPTLNWYNKEYIGIDQGPLLLMIENFRTGLIWNYVMKDPVIQGGLKRLGFTIDK